MLSKQLTKYLIEFLLGAGNEACCEYISYGEYTPQKSRVTITPSDFWDHYLTADSMPVLPCKMVDGVPILYGDTRIIEENQTIQTTADVIASSFFLLTRYEEYINRTDRDEHGRFPASASFPKRAGFLARPIVDEYGVLLRGWLRKAGINVGEADPHIQKIYLTHDVDTPWSPYSSIWYSVRAAAKDVLVNHQSPMPSIRKCVKAMKNDPLMQAWDWLKKKDAQYQNSNDQAEVYSFFFMLCCDDNPHDNGYAKKRHKACRLIGKLRVGADIGLHISYYAGLHPDEIQKEATCFEKLTGSLPAITRYHFLACREPEDLHSVIDAGISDDFSHAYADEAGFRLGTSRPVRWIDPKSMKLTELTLHPMTIMECTLDMEQYMGLNENDAYMKCCELIDSVKENCGEAVLLWHNESVTEDTKSYQKRLYSRVLEYLSEVK